MSLPAGARNNHVRMQQPSPALQRVQTSSRYTASVHLRHLQRNDSIHVSLKITCATFLIIFFFNLFSLLQIQHGRPAVQKHHYRNSLFGSVQATAKVRAIIPQHGEKFTMRRLPHPAATPQSHLQLPIPAQSLLRVFSTTDRAHLVSHLPRRKHRSRRR